MTAKFPRARESLREGGGPAATGIAPGAQSRPGAGRAALGTSQPSSKKIPALFQKTPRTGHARPPGQADTAARVRPPPEASLQGAGEPGGRIRGRRRGGVPPLNSLKCVGERGKDGSFSSQRRAPAKGVRRRAPCPLGSPEPEEARRFPPPLATPALCLPTFWQSGCRSPGGETRGLANAACPAAEMWGVGMQGAHPGLWLLHGNGVPCADSPLGARKGIPVPGGEEVDEG